MTNKEKKAFAYGFEAGVLYGFAKPENLPLTLDEANYRAFKVYSEWEAYSREDKP
jgi:hypothetical protein